MRNRSFARWSAPFVGLAIGVWVPFRLARKEGQPVDLQMLLIFTIIGGVAGLVVLLADPPDGFENRGSFTSRMLAIASVPFAIIPVFGLLVGSLAVFLNRQVTGWPKVASWIGGTFALITTSVICIAIGVSARSKPSPPAKPPPAHVRPAR
jgi:hypothetical protein